MLPIHFPSNLYLQNQCVFSNSESLVFPPDRGTTSLRYRSRCSDCGGIRFVRRDLVVETKNKQTSGQRRTCLQRATSHTSPPKQPESLPIQAEPLAALSRSLLTECEFAFWLPTVSKHAILRYFAILEAESVGKLTQAPIAKAIVGKSSFFEPSSTNPLRRTPMRVAHAPKRTLEFQLA
jgi:hypothetical protein